MFDPGKLRIEINNFRAVRSADIVLGDITVLSGVNASGKSTIAHLFHLLVNLNRSYDELALEFAWRPVRNVWWTIRRFLDRFGHDSFWDDGASASLDMRIEAFRHDLEAFNEKYKDVLSTKSERAIQYLRSVLSALSDVLDIEDVDETNNLNLGYLNQCADQLLGRIRTRYDELKLQRSRTVWRMVDPEVLKWLRYDGDVKFFEGNRLVYASEAEQGEIDEIFGFDHAFYIESPWRNLPDVQGRRLTIHDGFDFHAAEESFVPDVDLFQAIGGRLAKRTERETPERRAFGRSLQTGLKFERNDGRGEYPLEDCATGIKSMSVLNFLHMYGCLNHRTLLVVDEPEAHLHPQWILEYAKILVQLNRRLGVRLLITTHSPDMLNAIRRVANVEEVPDLRFYLAEGAEMVDPIDYNYKPLGREVEDIFRAFNLAADRTESYGMATRV